MLYLYHLDCLIKKKLNKLIQKFKSEGKYFEGIQDFLNEIEQKVFKEDED